MDFRMDFWLFWICFIKNVKKLTKKRATSKICTKVKKVNKHPLQRNPQAIGSMDLNIYSLERNPLLWPDKQRKSQDVHQNYLCDFHLCIDNMLQYYRPLEESRELMSVSRASLPSKVIRVRLQENIGQKPNQILSQTEMKSNKYKL